MKLKWRKCVTRFFFFFFSDCSLEHSEEKTLSFFLLSFFLSFFSFSLSIVASTSLTLCQKLRFLCCLSCFDESSLLVLLLLLFVVFVLLMKLRSLCFLLLLLFTSESFCNSSAFFLTHLLDHCFCPTFFKSFFFFL